jgi:sigma-B regulation protein RsbU (phosphoserine phosphatase)
MKTTETGTSSPKHLFRLAERTYSGLEAKTEHALLERALRSTLDLLQEQGGQASGRIDALEEVSDPARVWKLLHERVVVGAAPAPSVEWLLRGKADWIARFELRAPPSEEVVVFLEIAREAVQLRLSEFAWTGVVDKVQAIQRSLLPDPIPRLAGFEIAARSVPAETVGGDVYDVIPVDSECLALAIGDASGHGLPAALEARDVVIGARMGILCGVRLTSLVYRLNEVLAGTTLSSRFVSLLLGELDAGGGFRYVNAGHPPPILAGAGPARFLEGTGRVLGISRSYRYELSRVHLPVGGMLVMYTDGVTECLSATGEELGAERLLRLAGLFGALSAATAVARLFEELRLHAGARGFHDDASILVAKRTGRSTS